MAPNWPRCGHRHPDHPVVTCDAPKGHPSDHQGGDSDGGRWFWDNEDD